MATKKHEEAQKKVGVRRTRTCRSGASALLFFSCLSVLFRGHCSSAAEPPRHVLEGHGLKLTLYLPDAANGYYRGTRFDWSGLVATAEFGGHVVFSNWLGKNAPTFHSSGSGTAEEFTEPLGYAEAPVGGTYVKIG